MVFAAPPQRIISGMPAITEMLYALDLEDQIIAVTTNCNYPTEVKKKEKIGGFFLNLEKIVSLKPDLMVLSASAQKKDIKIFGKFGLLVKPVDPQSVEEVMKTLLELGKVTGKDKEAQDLVKQLKQRLVEVKKTIKKHKPLLADVLKLWGSQPKERKALVIVGLDPLIVAGGGTFVDDILKKSGVENLAKKAKAAYPQYSIEMLVQENPQYLIIADNLMSEEKIKKDPRWSSLHAIRDNRVLFINADILSRPGPRVVEAIETIVDFVY